MIDESEFRRLLGHFASGVTVVTTVSDGERPSGLTVTAFSSLSLEPPLVLVCIERGADTHDRIADNGVFGVSILAAEDGERLSRRFSEAPVEDRFDSVGYRTVEDGIPILDRAIAWIACRLRSTADGGDHTIFIGEVIAGDAVSGNPLVYFRGGYGTFEP